MKPGIPCMVFVLITVCSFRPGADPANQFRYAFGIETDKQVVLADKSEISLAFLKSRPRFYFLPIKNAFLYLLVIDDHDRIIRLFPDSFKIFKEPQYSTFPRYYIPENKQWPLQDAGSCSIWFLVSAKRLTDLEILLTRCQDLKPGKTDKQRVIGLQVISEIHRIERDYFFKPDAIELAPEGTGIERSGSGEKIEFYASTVHFNEYYIKTFKVNE